MLYFLLTLSEHLTVLGSTFQKGVYEANLEKCTGINGM